MLPNISCIAQTDTFDEISILMRYLNDDSQHNIATPTLNAYYRYTQTHIIQTKHLNIEFLSSNTHEHFYDDHKRLNVRNKIKKKIQHQWMSWTKRMRKKNETKMNRVSGVDELLTNNVEYIIDGIKNVFLLCLWLNRKCKYCHAKNGPWNSPTTCNARGQSIFKKIPKVNVYRMNIK